MTPADYNALPPQEAKACARRLPPDAQLRLAVALSATRSPWGLGASYNFWLRLWKAKEKSSVIVQERFL